MSVINTNVSATLAANAIARNDRAMGTAMERLSTGLRINSAKDDAAGLAISTRMTSQVVDPEYGCCATQTTRSQCWRSPKARRSKISQHA